MKWLILMAALGTAASTLAATETTKTYAFSKEKITFVHRQEERLTISQSCVKNGELRCEAFTKLKDLSRKKLVELKPNGESVGSQLCKLQLKGKVVIGLSDQGDENSFCRMKDGSLVDNGTLVYFARKNDEAKKSN